MTLMYGAGVISALLGIGSGVLKIPAMDTALRLPMKVSSATSNFMIGVTAAASAGAYFLRGGSSRRLPVRSRWGGRRRGGGRSRADVVSSDKLRVVFVIVLVALALRRAERVRIDQRRTPGMNVAEDRALESLLSTTLQYGTWLAVAVIGFGLGLPLFGQSLLHLKVTSDQVVAVGIVLLILLPIVRVGLMLIVFVRSRAILFGAIAGFVLSIILMGLIAALIR